MPPNRLPIVDSDDGVWGDILRQYLTKEHVNDDTDNPLNGGHKKITIQAGTTGAGTAPIKFTSGSLMTTPEAGAIEYDGNFHMTRTGNTRTTIVGSDTTQTLTNKTLTTPLVGGDITQSGNRPFLNSDHTGSAGFAGGVKWQQSGVSKLEMFYDTSSHVLNYWNSDGTDTGSHMSYSREGYMYIGSGSGVDMSTRLKIHDSNSAVTSGDVRGLHSEVYLNPSGSASTRAWGVQFIGGTKAGNAQNLTGGDALQGFEGKAHHAGTGTVTGASGGLLYVENSSTGTITNARSLNLFPMANGGGGTITNAYHIVANWLPNFTANNQTRIAIDVVASMPDPGSYTGTTVAGLRLNGDNGVRDGILFYNDTTLYRSAANTLKTDDNLIVGTPGTSSGSVATIDGTQTLTNKTLTDPKVNAIENTTGTTILSMATNAINFYDPTTSSLGFQVEGVGSAVNYPYTNNSTTGNAVRFGSWGSDSNVHLDLVTKGTGAVRANGIEVSTISGTQTLTNKTLVAPAISVYDTSLTVYDTDITKTFNFDAGSITAGNNRVYSVPDANTTLVGHDVAQTLTNKRVTKRVHDQNAPGATPTLAWDSYDVIILRGISAAITSMSSGITGSPTQAQTFLIRFKDDGTARAITWGASYRAIGVTLPTTTTLGKTIYVGGFYNSTDSKYDVMAVGTEA